MFRITAVWGPAPGSPYYTTLYFGGSTAGEVTAGGVAMADFIDDLEPYVTTPTAWTLLPDAEYVDPASGQVIGTDPITPASGASTASGGACPPTTQGLLRWRTGVYVAGREIRGRTFIPIPSETDNDAGGVPRSAYRSGVLSAANTLLTAASAAGDLVVYSPTHGQSAPVSSASVWTEWAVLRSRRP